MSNLKTWIQKEEAKIKLLFISVGHLIQSVLLPAAIKVTSALKAITDVDGLDLIGHLAGAGGSETEDRIRTVLPKVIADLQIAQVFLASNPSSDDLIKKVVEVGLSLTGNARAAFLIEFSGRLATEISDGKLTVQESILLTQSLYQGLNKQPVATA
jgi:hypothetical protein